MGGKLPLMQLLGYGEDGDISSSLVPPSPGVLLHAPHQSANCSSLEKSCVKTFFISRVLEYKISSFSGDGSML